MDALEKVSSQMLPFSMMELPEQTGKQLCLQKGVVGSSRMQEVLRLEEEPSKSVLSLKPMCCETAAELIRTFLPSFWPWQFIPAPPVLPCGCAVCCVPGPQVGSLGGSKAMRSLSHWRFLCGTAHI